MKCHIYLNGLVDVFRLRINTLFVYYVSVYVTYTNDVLLFLIYSPVVGIMMNIFFLSFFLMLHDKIDTQIPSTSEQEVLCKHSECE